MDRSAESRFSVVSGRTYAFVWTGLVAGAFISALTLIARGVAPMASWPALVFLAAAALATESFSGRGPCPRTSHQLALAFVAAAVLLLPPVGVALVVLAAQVPSFARRELASAGFAARVDLSALLAWLIASLAAKAAFTLLGGPVATSLGSVGDSPAAVVVALILLGLLIRGLGLAVPGAVVRRSRREVAELMRERIGADVTLCCLGLITALLWQMAPVLGLLVLAPLILTRRALDAPALERLTRTDPKTGLYNARHFGQVLQEESRRSARFGRPFTVVMTDLDLLRDINNTYGHLAGDVALQTVSNVIRESLREYDVAARFGGEEFVILLPECELAKGLVVAERLRESVQAARFLVPTAAQPIGVTLSLGVAAFPAHGATPQAVVHQADLAVYRAKAAGRNRVCAADRESGAMGASGAGGEAPTWSAPVAGDGASEHDSEPTAGILAADLLSRSRELALVTSGERGGADEPPTGAGDSAAPAVGENSLGVARTGTASAVAVAALVALGAVALTADAWMNDGYHVVGQSLIVVLGLVAIAANAATRQALFRVSAEVVHVRRENRLLTESLEETRSVVRRLARQISALVEGRAAEDDPEAAGEGARGEWLDVIERAARRQRSGDVFRKRPVPRAAEGWRERDAPPTPPSSFAS